VLTAAAWTRGAEYDEQYSVFLLAGDARPAWPSGVFTAGAVRGRFHGDASPLRIAADLRRGDVHPPLYFWVLDAWRRIVGDTLYRLRLFSVLCGTGALAVVGLIARRSLLPPALAMLLTLGCYAFTYTGAVARGFALAQVLALLGVLAALHATRARRWAGGAAGLLLGAASFTNYLAAFTAGPALLWLAWRRPRDAVRAGAAFALFVGADLVFFLAQRGARPGQFPPFHLTAGLARLAQYGAGAIVGGLPLYLPGRFATLAAVLIAGFLAALVGLVAARWPRIGMPSARLLLVGAAVATPSGLLLLGIVFDNTPIELRYLAFGVPYVGLLLAGALASLKRPARRAAVAAVLTVQAAAIAGLLLRPETQQPMQEAAREAAAQAGPRTVVLLPRGNDGVGIVGAFVTAAPDNLRILLVDPTARAAGLHAVASRVVLVRLERDAASGATVEALLTGFAADPCWRALPGGFKLTVFQCTCGDGSWVSSTASR